MERAYDTLDQLLADDAVEVVHICTPNALHAEQALAVIRAGKHVICEKPLATTSVDARALVDAATGAGVVATVPFVYRFHPMVREARARFREARLDALFSIQGSYLQDWLLEISDDNWRVDAGRAAHHARLPTSVPIWSTWSSSLPATGSPASPPPNVPSSQIACSTARYQPRMPLQSCSRRAEVQSASLLVSQVAPGRKNRLHLEIAGTARASAFDQENPESLWLGSQEGKRGDSSRRVTSYTRMPRGSRSCRPGTRRATRTLSTRSSQTAMPRSGRGPKDSAILRWSSRGSDHRSRDGHGRDAVGGHPRRVIDTRGPTHMTDRRTQSPCLPGSGPISRSRRSRARAAVGVRRPRDRLHPATTSILSARTTMTPT